ncbi:MAG: right-handed parallel beta-helix repeat-containing protein [Spirochaetales bacterium]|nr:right-handed parallel beta-helix repeat-containing protein [Spirochaetales bacterium]
MPILKNILFLSLILWQCQSPSRPPSSSGLPVITVSSTEEFLRSLGPDRVIRLKAGKYILNDFLHESRYLRRQNVFDGYEYAVVDVKNLTIEGAGKASVELLVRPRYANVLRFQNASGITIRNLTAGHTEESGSCVGGVFVFENSTAIDLEGTRLFGSGTQGLELLNVRNFRFESGSIEDCTYHTMTVEGSRDILFARSVFTRNREFSQINLRKSQGVILDQIEIKSNVADDALIFLESSELTIKNSRIENNRASMLIEEKDSSRFHNINNTIESNDFRKKP